MVATVPEAVVGRLVAEDLDAEVNWGDSSAPLAREELDGQG